MSVYMYVCVYAFIHVPVWCVGMTDKGRQKVITHSAVAWGCVLNTPQQLDSLFSQMYVLIIFI